MADSDEQNQTGQPEPERDDSIESEGIGPLGWISSITKAASEALVAENLGKVVKSVVVDWAGEQAADKVVEGAEKAIDYKPPDLPPPSPPVDMGGPAMGVPPDPNDQPIQDASAPWDPDGKMAPSVDAGVPTEQDPVEAAPVDPPFIPVDMGTAAMGVPFEPEPAHPIAPFPADNPVAPPVDAGPVLVAPTWDPASDANWFTGPTEMPPIPLAPNEE